MYTYNADSWTKMSLQRMFPLNAKILRFSSFSLHDIQGHCAYETFKTKTHLQFKLSIFQDIGYKIFSVPTFDTKQTNKLHAL